MTLHALLGSTPYRCLALHGIAAVRDALSLAFLLECFGVLAAVLSDTVAVRGLAALETTALAITRHRAVRGVLES